MTGAGWSSAAEWMDDTRARLHYPCRHDPSHWIRRQSVRPHRLPLGDAEEAGALSVLRRLLERWALRVDRPVFSDDGTADSRICLRAGGARGVSFDVCGTYDVVPPVTQPPGAHPALCGAK